jgi:hypothetical protein
VPFKAQIVGEDAEPRDIFGPTPFGRLILTPAHTMAAFLSRPDREPPTGDTEAATLLRSMTAYTDGRRIVDLARIVLAVVEAVDDPGTANIGRYFLGIGDGSSSGKGDFIRDDTVRLGGRFLFGRALIRSVLHYRAIRRRLLDCDAQRRAGLSLTLEVAARLGLGLVEAVERSLIGHGATPIAAVDDDLED